MVVGEPMVVAGTASVVKEKATGASELRAKMDGFDVLLCRELRRVVVVVSVVVVISVGATGESAFVGMMAASVAISMGATVVVVVVVRRVLVGKVIGTWVVVVVVTTEASDTLLNSLVESSLMDRTVSSTTATFTTAPLSGILRSKVGWRLAASSGRAGTFCVSCLGFERPSWLPWLLGFT